MRNPTTIPGRHLRHDEVAEDSVAVRVEAVEIFVKGMKLEHLPEEGAVADGEEVVSCEIVVLLISFSEALLGGSHAEEENSGSPNLSSLKCLCGIFCHLH